MDKNYETYKIGNISEINEVLESLRRIKTAADLGDTGAMYVYANILLQGNVISVNEEEAIKYYEMAATYGNPEAMEKLVDILFTKRKFGRSYEVFYTIRQ